MVLTEYQVECYGDEFRIKFYTTFKASATRSILSYKSPKSARYIIHQPGLKCNVISFFRRLTNRVVTTFIGNPLYLYVVRNELLKFLSVCISFGSSPAARLMATKKRQTHDLI